MRIALLLFIICNGALIAQNSEPSPAFIPLSQVEQAPLFTGCERVEFTECSQGKIASHFIENLDPALIESLTPDETVVIVRFIVDSSGKVRNFNVQSKSENLKVAAMEVLKAFPDFKPGLHQGQKVNVIINLPLKIEISDPVYQISDNEISPAMAVNCGQKKDSKKCTSEMIQNFILNNFKIPTLKTNGQWLKAEIKFIINNEGQITNVTAIGDNEEFNKEGVRVIEKLPKFIPGSKDGKNIAVEYNLPIMMQAK